MAHYCEVSNLIRRHNIGFLGIIETKVTQRNSSFIASRIRNSWNWFFDYSSNSGKRIWIGWDVTLVCVHVVESSPQAVHCRVTYLGDDSELYITVVYGSNSSVERRELWADLVGKSEAWMELPWLIMGDFNAVLDSNEARGGRVESNDVNDFKECLNTAGLQGVSHTGAFFTWFNQRVGDNGIWRRLDRMIANPSWFTTFMNSSYHVDSPATSDHSPLILKFGMDNRAVGTCFRFENFLTSDANFLPIVTSIWRHRIIGVPLYAIVQKLKSLKPHLRALRKSKGNLNQNVVAARNFLLVCQEFLIDYPFEESLLRLEKCCRAVLAKAISMEQEFLSQKAKMSWLRDGDQCTAFFFKKIALRRTFNRILRLEDSNGGEIHDPQLVREEILRFYSGILGQSARTNTISCDDIRGFISTTLTVEEANRMILPVTGEEVRAALFSIPDDKAPGPDGFTSAFFKGAWAVIGDEVIQAIINFFETGRLVKSVNSTLITLIPKTTAPRRASDFRPISCCNVLYKVISKIITDRMKEALPRLVHPSQTAFIPGRRISDNILLAQELCHGYNRNDLPPRCSFKVDLAKAYDMVEWDFILGTLECMGFHRKFIGWIRECMCSTQFSININGRAEGLFRGARGLRQGDPMSPYLFTIAMEVLHGILDNFITTSGVFRFHWRCASTRTFMLTFADDLLLFSQADADSIGVLRSGLDLFADLSGLKANPAKSLFFLSSTAHDMADMVHHRMGFQHGTLPIRYLGVPLITSKLSLADCHPLISTLEARINSWVNRALSYAGRVQLIKSVLSSMHIYWSGIFLLPKGVIRKIESLIRRFLWSGGSSQGYPKVAWEEVCMPRDEGGLGIRSLLITNRALVLKHLWAICCRESSSVWVVWVLANRLQNQSIWSINPSTRSAWSWRQILKLRPMMLSAITFRIGRGDDIFTWLDPWLEGRPLIDRLPNGPLMTGIPRHTRLNQVIDALGWRWPECHEVEISEMYAQLPQVYPTDPDSIIWNHSADGRFTASSAFDTMRTHGPKMSWAILLQGKAKIPKHDFILWLAIRERLATRDKPWIGRDQVHCLLCDCGAVETIQHLFFDCEFSGRCLRILTNTVRFQWPRRLWQEGIRWGSTRWSSKHLVNFAYRRLLASIVYHVWRERNMRWKEGVSRSAEAITHDAVSIIIMRFQSLQLRDDLHTRALKRIWHIAW